MCGWARFRSLSEALRKLLRGIRRQAEATFDPAQVAFVWLSVALEEIECSVLTLPFFTP